MARRVCMTTRITHLTTNGGRSRAKQSGSRTVLGLPGHLPDLSAQRRLWALAPDSFATVSPFISTVSNTGLLLHTWTRLLTVPQTEREHQPLAFAYTAPH